MNKENVLVERHQVAGSAAAGHSKPLASVSFMNYQTVRTLGEGKSTRAFGEVKLIIDTKSSRAVAMKCINLTKCTEENIKAVKKEVLIHRHLGAHPNVLQYIGHRTEDNAKTYLIFLEYADGGELFDQIEPDVGIPPWRAQFYFRQLIDGIEFLHKIGVAHRDIKPENLLLKSNDVLKISDFGMATMFRHDGKERLLEAACGTLPYVAPEVLQGKYKGDIADIWSCGIVLITMLTGELPWDRPDDYSASYMDWLSNTGLDDNPWKKLDVKSLALIRIIVNEKVDCRATIARIRQNPWFIHDYGFRMEKPMANEYSATAAKRRKLNETVSQTHYDSETRAFADACSEMLRVMNNSFSQPGKLEELLIGESQIDFSQKNLDFVQRLSRRMTRFCVNVGLTQIVPRITDAAQSCGYIVKEKITTQLFITFRDTSMAVQIYELAGSDQAPPTLVDFRRSKGDGLVFKRMFIEIKKKLKDLISKSGDTWLMDKGLTYSQTPPHEMMDTDQGDSNGSNSGSGSDDVVSESSRDTILPPLEFTASVSDDASNQ
ncbi:hypothetical protein WR25_02765 [Diploscapter pachys]|uniref:non-specific serine/threonine protein kinase n=1 Tax=Diploscapter pachys TaxID=2018661 RepID=A0A2A2J2D3_9BILA|nr:hypothetical protein WR25_02765 [Diploscapter pachys]